MWPSTTIAWWPTRAFSCRPPWLLTLVMSALAGGDWIDDADALRAGGTARVLGFTVKAAWTLGTFLRSFRWATSASSTG
jgi:hypothetical protein